MSTGQNVILKPQHLNYSEQKLENILSFMNKFNLELKMNRNIHTERYKSD